MNKKEPKTFYRIEYKDGFGLHEACDFNGNCIVSEYLPELVDRHCNDLPNYNTDEEIKKHYIMSSVWRFAFNSMSDLRELVTSKEMNLLKSLHFKLYKIVAEDYWVSEYQAIFNINSVISKEEYEYNN